MRFGTAHRTVAKARIQYRDAVGMNWNHLRHEAWHLVYECRPTRGRRVPIAAVSDSLRQAHISGEEILPSLFRDLAGIDVSRRSLPRFRDRDKSCRQGGHNAIQLAHSGKLLLFSTISRQVLRIHPNPVYSPEYTARRAEFSKDVCSVEFKQISQHEIVEPFLNYGRLGTIDDNLYVGAIRTVFEGLIQQATRGEDAMRSGGRNISAWLESFPHVVLHNDLHHWNIVFANGHPFVIDFDNLGFGPSWIDAASLGMFAIARFRNNGRLRRAMTDLLGESLSKMTPFPAPAHWRRLLLGSALRIGNVPAEVGLKLVECSEWR